MTRGEGEDDDSYSCNVTVIVPMTRRGSTPAARMTSGEDDDSYSRNVTVNVPITHRGPHLR